MAKARQLLYQTNSEFVRMQQDKETMVWGAQLVKNLNRILAWVVNFKSSKVCLYKLLSLNSLYLSIRASFYLQMESLHLPREFYSLLTGRQKGGSKGPSCIEHFFSNFNSKLTIMPLKHVLGCPALGPSSFFDSVQCFRGSSTL